MARGLDHIVHAVRDLDAAAGLYRRLGFQVGARNRHPRAWGTQNHIVQLPGTFIELLDRRRHHRDRAARTALLFLRRVQPRFSGARARASPCWCWKAAARPTRRSFAAAGIGDFELYEFEREGTRPDGTPIRVAFALAFASDPHSPDTGFFTCQHRYPESFWNPAFQQHPNTAAAVAGVVLVAENPSDHHIFLEAFTGEREAQATSAGIGIRTPARPDPGDGARGVPRPFRHRAARRRGVARGLRRSALPCAIWRPSNEGFAPRTCPVPAGWQTSSSARTRRWAQPWFLSRFER